MEQLCVLTSMSTSQIRNEVATQYGYFIKMIKSHDEDLDLHLNGFALEGDYDVIVKTLLKLRQTLESKMEMYKNAFLYRRRNDYPNWRDLRSSYYYLLAKKKVIEKIYDEVEKRKLDYPLPNLQLLMEPQDRDEHHHPQCTCFLPVENMYAGGSTLFEEPNQPYSSMYAGEPTLFGEPNQAYSSIEPTLFAEPNQPYSSMYAGESTLFGAPNQPYSAMYAGESPLFGEPSQHYSSVYAGGSTLFGEPNQSMYAGESTLFGEPNQPMYAGEYPLFGEPNQSMYALESILFGEPNQTYSS